MEAQDCEARMVGLLQVIGRSLSAVDKVWVEDVEFVALQHNKKRRKQQRRNMGKKKRQIMSHRRHKPRTNNRKSADKNTRNEGGISGGHKN